MKRLIVILILTVAALAAVAAERRSIATYLDLTPAQGAVWEEAERALHQTMEPLARQQRAERQQLEALLASKADACAVGEQQLRIFALSEQMRSAERTFEQKSQALLTPDQKAKLASLQEEHFKREMSEVRERHHD